jgi:hypothetical protein
MHWGDAKLMSPTTRGMLLDLLVHDGGVTVFRCRRPGLRMWLFWAFVAAAIAGSMALAIFKG